MKTQLNFQRLTASFLILYRLFWPIIPVQALDASQSGEIMSPPSSEASLSAQIQVIADTGNNLQTASDSAIATETGPATAIANSQNQVNLETDNSQLSSTIINSGSDSDLDLSSSPPPPASASCPPSPSAPTPAISSESNQATSLIATTSATANTGNNILVTASSAQLVTHNATAIANVIDLINLTLKNSQVDIIIANIESGSDSIIILPRPELFSQLDPAKPSTSSTSINFSHQAWVDTSLTVLATTGNNQSLSINPANQLVTGDAITLAQQISLVNSLIQGESFSFVLVNHPLTSFSNPISPTEINFNHTPTQTSWIYENLNPTPASISSSTNLGTSNWQWPG